MTPATRPSDAGPPVERHRSVPPAPTSILRRLLIGLTVTVGMSSTLVVALLAAVALRSADDQLNKNIESSVTEVAQLLESPLWDIDMERATRIGEAFAQDPRIVRLTIHETTSDVTRTIERSSMTDTAARTRRVVHNGRVVGDVSIAFSRAFYQQQAWRQVLIAIGVSLIALLATLFGVRLLLSRLLRRPLAEVSEVVAAYAEGRYGTARADVAEFQPFLSVLDAMGNRITRQLTDLQTGNEQLEAEVAVRRGAESALRSRNEELATLNRFLAVAAEEERPEVLLEHACRELATSLGMPGACAMLLDELDASLKVVAQVGMHEHSMRVGTLVGVDGKGDIRRFLRAGSPLASRDVRADQRFAALAQLFQPTGVVGLIAMPLVTLGVTVGAIVLTSPEGRKYTESELALVAGVAAQAGGALSRHRARTAERMLRAAIEQIPESVVMTDPAGRIEYVNAAFTSTTGYDSAEVLGRNPRMLDVEQHDEAFYEAIRLSLSAGRTWHGRFAGRSRSGKALVIDGLITPVRNERGAVAHFVGIGRDITRELEREDQLLHAQKLEAVGQLAGGIAHDFNNIMGAMLMELELLDLEHALPVGIAEGIHNVRSSVDRAAKLTRQLLLFSRRQAMEVQPHDLNLIVADLLRMLTRVIGENVSVEFTRSDVPLYVDVDAGMIEQVLTNLSVNARDAMPSGGRLAISLQRVELDAESVEHRPHARPGAFACIRVADTGSGMTPEVQRRVFEPFFTTKDVGKGSGLGLATTYGIVAQHHGWIEVASDVGRGTTFEILLPLLAGSEALAASRTAAPSMQKGTEVILLVEDEKSLRTMVSRALRQLGYHVHEAASGVEALAMWDAIDGGVDLVMTDMVMPGGITGLELSSRLRARKSTIEVIVMSGYSVDLVEDGDVIARDVHFLGKPFTIATLSDAVRAALDGAQPTPK